MLNYLLVSFDPNTRGNIVCCYCVVIVSTRYYQVYGKLMEPETIVEFLAF